MQSPEKFSHTHLSRVARRHNFKRYVSFFSNILDTQQPESVNAPVSASEDQDVM